MRNGKSASTVVICLLWALASLPGCTPIPMPLAGEGAISAIDPAEGTLGTEITLTGSNLGSVPGQVFVGTVEAQVCSWTETQIVARLVEALPPGDYDIRVNPWWEAPLVFSSFAVRPPMLESPTFRPQFVSGGETLTVRGRFLGQDKGVVSLQSPQGRSVAVQVLDWSEHVVTLEVPAGLSGLWNLVIANRIGEAIEPRWATFEPCPEGASSAPLSGDTVPGVSQNTNNTPVPIQFEGDLWLLSSGDSYNNLKADRCVNGCIDSTDWIDAPDPPGKSLVSPMPLIVDGTLWLFNTDTDGTIEYFKYNSTANTWTSATKVPNATTDKNYSSLGVAYNNVPPYDRIELFFYSGGSIWRMYTDNRGGAWSVPAIIAASPSTSLGASALFWEKAVYWDDTKRVTVEVPNATLVAHPDYTTQSVYVGYYQDGRLVHETKSPFENPYSWYYTMWYTSLVDLGEEYIAACTIVPGSNSVGIRKMSKATGQWESIWYPVDRGSYAPDDWRVTGAVGVQKLADANSKGGYRYDTYFFLFYGDNNYGSIFGTDHWEMAKVEYLGYYIEPNPPVPASFATQTQENFYLWPVIGIVDAPPFVLNGHSIDEFDCNPATECTRAEFGAEGANYLTIGGSASAGPYFETGEHCPVKVEISAEVNASINKETSFTSGREDTLFRTPEGIVMVFYLTPEFQTHTYEWFNHGDTSTGKYFYVVEVIRTDITRKTFSPQELPVPDALNVSEPYWGDRFPLHAADTDLARLGTYGVVPTEPYWFSSSGDWGRASDGAIKWVAETKTETEGGIDIEFKVGKGGMIGGGVEGSFTLHVSMTTQLTASAKIALINPDASNAARGDVESFHAIGYWLKPDADAYWVPRNRQGMGDKPWFITYWVSPTPYTGH